LTFIRHWGFDLRPWGPPRPARQSPALIRFCIPSSVFCILPSPLSFSRNTSVSPMQAYGRNQMLGAAPGRRLSYDRQPHALCSAQRRRIVTRGLRACRSVRLRSTRPSAPGRRRPSSPEDREPWGVGPVARSPETLLPGTFKHLRIVRRSYEQRLQRRPSAATKSECPNPEFESNSKEGNSQFRYPWFRSLEVSDFVFVSGLGIRIRLFLCKKIVGRGGLYCLFTLSS